MRLRNWHKAVVCIAVYLLTWLGCSIYLMPDHDIAYNIVAPITGMILLAVYLLWVDFL